MTILCVCLSRPHLSFVVGLIRVSFVFCDDSLMGSGIFVRPKYFDEAEDRVCAL